MIDWLLKLMGQTTRKELLETIAILRNQCDHYQLVNQKERESYAASLQKINDGWSEQHQNLLDEMQANGLTKAQLDEQANVQLERALIDGLAMALYGGEAAHIVAPAPDIDGMVSRFLGWKLPQNFYPDCYVSFDREKASQSPHGWPIGTNLLTAEQARKMFEYVMASTPCQVEFHTEECSK